MFLWHFKNFQKWSYIIKEISKIKEKITKEVKLYIYLN